MRCSGMGKTDINSQDMFLKAELTLILHGFIRWIGGFLLNLVLWIVMILET